MVPSWAPRRLWSRETLKTSDRFPLSYKADFTLTVAWNVFQDPPYVLAQPNKKKSHTLRRNTSDVVLKDEVLRSSVLVSNIKNSLMQRHGVGFYCIIQHDKNHQRLVSLVCYQSYTSCFALTGIS